MAAVDILPAFSYRFGENGAIEAMQDTQYKTGWAYIGATPPSVEQFNKVFNVQDAKANYLYAQMKAVFDAAGEVPDANDLNSLRDALASLYGGGRLSQTVRVFGTSGTYTPTAGTKFIKVRMIGGGGAGGGAVVTGANACSAGSGGGSGAFVEGIITSNFAGQLMTVGAGGAPANGASGGSGGATTLAGLSAGGGLGGAIFGPGAIPLTASQGNTAVSTGGSINVPGQNGGGIFVLSANAGLSGIGANGMWGNGGTSSNGGDGGAGTGFGSGGSGGLNYSNSATARSGGAGRPGLIVIEEFI